MNQNKNHPDYKLAEAVGKLFNPIKEKSGFIVIVDGKPISINDVNFWITERSAKSAVTHFLTQILEYGGEEHQSHQWNNAHKMIQKVTGISLKWSDYSFEVRPREGLFDTQYERYQKAIKKSRTYLKDILFSLCIIEIVKI